MLLQYPKSSVGSSYNVQPQKVHSRTLKGIETKKIGREIFAMNSTSRRNNRLYHFSLVPGSPFKKSRFADKISVRGDKIHLSIYIPSEMSGFFG